MVKANALFIVIIIALVIGLLSSSLILLAYHHRIEVLHNLALKRLELNVSSGINLILTENGLLNYDEEKFIDLYEEELDSVMLKKMNWGIYEVGVAKAFSGRNEIIKSIQYGYGLDSISKASIYLVDGGRPVSICGKTMIKGLCYLPAAGIKRAYIEGQSYTGFELVKGKVKKSSNALPPLNKKITDNLLKFFNRETDSVAKAHTNIALLERDTVYRSFLEKPILIFKKGPIKLDEKIISGNIMIGSDTLIIIDASTQISDVILFAPVIKIMRGFKGNLQLFATDSIVIAEDCVLHYPSALGVFKMDFKVQQPFIEIKNNAVVKGFIFTQQHVNDLRQTLIKIDKDAEVHGQVYADGYVEISGKVFGNITCSKFTLKTPSSIYENHLLNATIDNSMLSSYYIGSSIVKSGNEKKIIKYLE